MGDMRRILGRHWKNKSQFKSAACQDSSGLDDLRSHYAAHVARRMVGPHALNQALIALLLKQVSHAQRRDFVMQAAAVLGSGQLSPNNTSDERDSEAPRTLGQIIFDIEQDMGQVQPALLFAEKKRGQRLGRPLRPSEAGEAIERELRHTADVQEAEAALEGLMRELLDGLPDVHENHFTSLALDELVEAFALSELERTIIVLLLAYRRCRQFEQFCDAHPISDWPQLISICCDSTPDRVRDALTEDAPLRAHGLIYRQDEDFPPYFALTPPVIDFLSGLAERPLADLFVRVDREPVHDLGSFPVGSMPRALLESFVAHEEPCHILLHGQAGTGKTEFARSLVHSAGKARYFVLPGEEGKSSERRIALAGGTRMARPEESVVIVDEADTLLNTDHPFRHTTVDKGWLNMFMDKCPAIVIWISNETRFIPTSIRRRFSYALAFKSLGRGQRLAMWDRLLADTPLDSLVPETTRRHLAGTFKVDAAGISGAIADVDRLLSSTSRTPEAVFEMLREVLECHQQLITGQPPEEVLDVAANYRPDALNIDCDRAALEASLVQAADLRAQGVAETRINLLFWGPPGTGKTEYAKHLACSMGQNLIVKTASHLLDMYVGNTEKLIRSAFEEAEAEEAILFIDEADTFFTERASADRSWEVSRTNELLQQMEKHNGILICCTNFLHGLDRAALRRFDWKVEFRPLDAANLIATYIEYFCKDRPSPEKADFRQLAAIEGATFGDLRAVAGRFRFVAPDNLPHEQLIKALQDEVAYRKGGSGKRLGFA